MSPLFLMFLNILGGMCSVVGVLSLLRHAFHSRSSNQYIQAKFKEITQQTSDQKPSRPGFTLPLENNIITILQQATCSPSCLRIYAPGSLHKVTTIPYQQLYDVAKSNAQLLQMLPDWRSGRPCLILLDQHYSNIRWFWSVVLAGGIPVMCPPYGPSNLHSNLVYLNTLLAGPLCLTTRAIVPNDSDAKMLQTYFIEDLEARKTPLSRDRRLASLIPTDSSIAAIMLTSGSSGNSKAVPLSHRQIFSSVIGKSHIYPREPNATVLNWIGMDHVAGLIESHIRALWAGADQVHVEAQDITSSPAAFIQLLGLHKISASFAPHFLLARIVDEVDANGWKLDQGLDLQQLRIIVSGGEACSTDVCLRFSRLLERYGAPKNVVVPGFGMTETCAGCIFNLSCPDSDMQHSYEFTAVGVCVPGVEIRIASLADGTSTSQGVIEEANTVGDLEIRGPILFRGYLNNEEANRTSFTADGWFRTGDMGFIDAHGHLVLTGRSKEIICINGVKHLPVDQERLIEDAKIPGVTPDHIVCFGWRPPDAHTEQGCVVYQHSFDVNDRNARAEAQKKIVKIFLMSTGARPHVVPLAAGFLEKSTLGKISRAKTRISFEQGLFAEEDARNTAMIRDVTVKTIGRPTNQNEEAILNIIASTLRLNAKEFGVETNYFEVGMTSLDLLRMRSRICRHFGLSDLSVEILITHNTVKSLTEAILHRNTKASCYNPVVKLKSTGAQTPLWLIHPGVGEVLVFVGLAHYIEDRPVFALRARGFEDGDGVFTNIDEAVTTYMKAIKTHQPHGPYAIAGYSYGAMLGFEITKRLGATGEVVPFLGCLNLPPHIKQRMRHLGRQICLIHLSMFLQLLSVDQAMIMELRAINKSFQSVLDDILVQCDQDRFRELDLSPDDLSRWAGVTYALQSMAVDYEPTGNVQNIDVFYADPLPAVARSRQEWLDVKLSAWRDFSHENPRYHGVKGAHNTMLSSTNVRGFYKVLEKAMMSRGV